MYTNDIEVMPVEVTKSLNCNEIKKADVIDSLGEKIGKIGDLTFKFDGELKLSQFILSGPRWEEFLEAIRVKPDRDPIFSASLIKKIGDDVHLDTTANSLKTTLDKGAFAADEIRLSKFSKLSIVDENDVNVGKAIDVDFDLDGSAWVIVGGGFIEEKLEAIGLKTDIDIIVPGNCIESIGDVVKLKVSKEELGKTVDEELEQQEPEIEKLREMKETERYTVKIRVFPKPM